MQITRPHATDAQLAQVIALGATGHSTRQIERITGFDHSTVARYLNDDGLRQKYKDLATQFAEHALTESRAKLSKLFLERIDQALDGDKPFSDQQLAVNLGIITDKMQRSSNINVSGPTIIFVEGDRHDG